ncbi:hypothetical protein VFPPC_18524 [Pochonia chlamydosporia 170]|uniref:Uncharacterized protein n=1 Tax=Pochonia chlamydosporia 170 TaxID=1380566 RepID=A0A219AQC2_METCM|nr:hypothetical protein VFPPC_18524 [Pochonia chlamydosporia 170]OWT42335.1 hypothetical protein VFPPC_18524 [Pochonia chlamydosporia 170]
MGFTNLQAILDYLNPSVSAGKANITHTTVRGKIVAALELHKQSVIHVCLLIWRASKRRWKLVGDKFDSEAGTREIGGRGLWENILCRVRRFANPPNPQQLPVDPLC